MWVMVQVEWGGQGVAEFIGELMYSPVELELGGVSDCKVLIELDHTKYVSACMLSSTALYFLVDVSVERASPSAAEAKSPEIWPLAI